MQVVADEPKKRAFRAFLDECQYSTRSILRYERIFGPGYVSTGGFETTKVCLCTALAPAQCSGSSAECCCAGALARLGDWHCSCCTVLAAAEEPLRCPQNLADTAAGGCSSLALAPGMP